MTEIILLLHAAATWFMVGVIWYAQIVHYPLLARVGPDSFAAYQAPNMARTGWVVIPAMVTEVTTALAILWHPPTGVLPCLPPAGLGLIVLIWTSTFLLQVPRHKVLTRGFDEEAHRFLVRSNWIRTAAWTARGVVALWMIVDAA